jgi:hypothetical protein
LRRNSWQQELDLGDVEAEWLEKNYRVMHDDEMAARLNRISSRMLAQLPPTQLKFRVILIDTPIVNSFSVGAGRIYITRKMVAFVRNDDELAGLSTPLREGLDGVIVAPLFALEIARLLQRPTSPDLEIASTGKRILREPP